MLSTAISSTTTPSATLPARCDFPFVGYTHRLLPAAAHRPGPARASPFPVPTIRPSRSPYPGGFLGTCTSRSSAPSMAFAVISAARHPLVPLSRLASRGCKIRVMLRAGWLLPLAGLSTLRFAAGRFPPTSAACYRASWQLPGPDSHRQADTSHAWATAPSSPPPLLVVAHAAGQQETRARPCARCCQARELAPGYQGRAMRPGRSRLRAIAMALRMSSNRSGSRQARRACHRRAGRRVPFASYPIHGSCCGR
jgi:hypothetical protein